MFRVTIIKNGERDTFLASDTNVTRRKVVHWLSRCDSLWIERTTPEAEAFLEHARAYAEDQRQGNEV